MEIFIGILSALLQYPLAIFFIVGILLIIFSIIGVIPFPSSFHLTKKVQRFSIAAVGVILIVFSGIVATFSSLTYPPRPTPTPTISSPATIASPTATPTPPTDFSVAEIKLKSGKTIQSGQSYPVAESPLTVIGTYSSQGSGNVWVVVQGNNGHYYLQKPPVQFVDSHQWTASNVITAVGASMIKFVYVTPQGQNSFQGMVDAGFYEFYSLPEGSKVLKDIPLQVIEG